MTTTAPNIPICVFRHYDTGGIGLHTKDSQFGRTPLMWLVLNGGLTVPHRVEATRQLLEAATNAGADDLTKLLNAQDLNGDTALHMVSKRRETSGSLGCSEIVKLLIDRGADVDIRNKSGWTPLHAACYEEGFIRAIQFLLDAGAEIDAMDNRNSTPLLQLCYDYGFPNRNAVALFLQRGADLDVENQRGQSPRQIVEDVLQNEPGGGGTGFVSGGHDGLTSMIDFVTSAAPVLKERGMPLDMSELGGRLLIAVMKYFDGSDDEDLVSLHVTPILEKFQPTDLNYVEEATGRTAFHALVVNIDVDEILWEELDGGQDEYKLGIFKYLKECGSSIDFEIVDNNGRTVAHYAAENGYHRLLEWLITDGGGVACCDIKDHNQQTPAEIAAEKGHAQCTFVLLRQRPESMSPSDHSSPKKQKLSD